MPPSSWRRRSRPKAGSSRSPSRVKGVTRAVKAPRRVTGCRVGRHVGRVLSVCLRSMRSRTRSAKSVMPGWLGSASSAVGREQGSGHVGGAVTCRDAQLERLARAVEADDVHPRVAAGAQRHDLQHVGIRRARPLGQARLALGGQVRQEPLGDGERRAGRAVRLRAAVLLEDVGVVVGEAAEEAGGLLGQLAEEDGGEAERGRDDGARIGRRQAPAPGLGRSSSVGRPAGRADDEAAAAGARGRRSTLASERRCVAELEGHVDGAERRRARGAACARPTTATTSSPRASSAARDGAAHVARPGDECSHRVWSPGCWWDRRPAPSKQKDRSTASVSAALGAGPAAPSRSSRTKPARPVPPGRAAPASSSGRDGCASGGGV